MWQGQKVLCSPGSQIYFEDILQQIDVCRSTVPPVFVVILLSSINLIVLTYKYNFVKGEFKFATNTLAILKY